MSKYWKEKTQKKKKSKYYTHSDFSRSRQFAVHTKCLCDITITVTFYRLAVNVSVCLTTVWRWMGHNHSWDIEHESKTWARHGPCRGHSCCGRGQADVEARLTDIMFLETIKATLKQRMWGHGIGNIMRIKLNLKHKPRFVLLKRLFLFGQHGCQVFWFSPIFLKWMVEKQYCI